MKRITPYLPLPEPICGVESAHRFDAEVFDAHQTLVAFVRPVIELEFIDAPQALRRTLGQPLMKPFRVVVQVTRGTGMFPHGREVLQVRMAPDFDPSLSGVLQGGFLRNDEDRPEPSKSKGELSLALIAPRAANR